MDCDGLGCLFWGEHGAAAWRREYQTPTSHPAGGEEGDDKANDGAEDDHYGNAGIIEAVFGRCESGSEIPRGSSETKYAAVSAAEQPAERKKCSEKDQGGEDRTTADDTEELTEI